MAALSSAGRRLGAQQPPIVIDGMGEIRRDYPMSLIEEVLASGVNAVQVTLGNPGLQGPEAWEDVLEEVVRFDQHVRENPEHLRKVTRAADLLDARERGRLGILYYLQNAAPLQDRAERLVQLHQLGVRSIQLTYNTRNLLGNGCLERVDGGLSHWGVQVVERMNQLGMVVDVSHCGARTSQDAILFSRAPVTINHAGCAAVYEHPRNKPDELLRAMADRGGVIGIYQINPYLGPAERNTLETFLDHVDHALKVAGVDHVGIGSDREHRRIPDTEAERQKLQAELDRLKPGTNTQVRWPFFLTELNHPRRMETVRQGLERRRHSASTIEKILGGNFERVFREVIG